MFLISFSDTPLITPDDREKILRELFELIGSESTKIQGLQQLVSLFTEVGLHRKLYF